jgi:hypothetical protein
MLPFKLGNVPARRPFQLIYNYLHFRMHTRIQSTISALLIVLLLSPAFISAQISGNVKHQRKDFERFQKGFNRLEGNPYMHRTEAEISAAFSTLEQELQQPLSPIQQFKAYSALLSQVECGHTSMAPSKAAIREWGRMKQCLPFDVVLVNKKLFIAPTHPNDIARLNKMRKADPAAVAPKYPELKGGTEIYSIDHKTIAEWMQLIGPYLSSDENGEDFKYFLAGMLFDFYRYVALPSQQQEADIQYISKKDTISTSVILGAPLGYTLEARLNVKPKKKKDFGTFKIEGGKYGYFRYESFEKSLGKDYDEFLKKSFTTIKKKKINCLIFDLRGNTGGMIQLELLRYLLPAGTQLGSYEILKQESWWGLRSLGIKTSQEMSQLYRKNLKRAQIARRKDPQADISSMTVAAIYKDLFYKGKIVVITDEGTFSAASLLTCHLKTIAGAKIVGQQAGGGFYAGNAGALQLKLKKSKLVFQVNPNYCQTHLNAGVHDSLIKRPDLIVFSEAYIPKEKFVKRKINTKDDPVIKAAQKLFVQ